MQSMHEGLITNSGAQFAFLPLVKPVFRSMHAVVTCVFVNFLTLTGKVGVTKSPLHALNQLHPIFSYTYRSERVGKTNVGGTLLTEAKYINLSLHYLEQVRTVTFVCHS